jgi:hypothetical protein
LASDSVGFEAEIRRQASEGAEVEKLEPVKDLLVIKKLANMFKLDPDVIYLKSADWCFAWLIADKLEREYQERFNEEYKRIKDNLTPNK